MIYALQIIALICFIIAIIYITVSAVLFRIIFSRKSKLISKLIIANEGKIIGEFAEEINLGKKKYREYPKEEITIKSFDGYKLTGYFLKGSDTGRLIICVHGYRAGPEHDFGVATDELLSFGDLLFIDQRAHGKSEGKYITFGVKECRDIKVWTDYIYSTYKDKYNVYLDGISMGATTVLMASTLGLAENVKGIIADCGFTSPSEIIYDVAGRTMRFGKKVTIAGIEAYCKRFAKFSLSENSTLDKIGEITLPVLFIHGVSDSLVPYRMTQQAYDKCTSQKALILSEKADHGMSYMLDRQKYLDECKALFDKCGKRNRHNDLS